MSWDILPKGNLQYFLTKLKGIFDNKVDKETGKGLFSGNYNDLTNKPTIPAAQVNSDWNASSGVAQILNKPTIPAAQVNSDWNASSGVAQILNKPTITDDKVKQTPVSNSSNYEVLFSGTADNVERTEGAKKSNLLRFNPNVGTLWATNVSASKLAYVNNTCFKSSNPPATMAVVEVPTVSGQLALLKPVSEAEYAALSQAEKTNGTIYFRYEANGVMREIQDNGSATSLISGALPTGQTIESYLNSNLGTSAFRNLMLDGLYIRRLTQTSNMNAVQISFLYGSYRTFSGILFTRYGACVFNVGFGSTIASKVMNVTRLSGEETFAIENTGTTDTSATFRIKTGVDWNSFYIMGFMATGGNENVYNIINCTAVHT